MGLWHHDRLLQCLCLFSMIDGGLVFYGEYDDGLGVVEVLFLGGMFYSIPFRCTRYGILSTCLFFSLSA